MSDDRRTGTDRRSGSSQGMSEADRRSGHADRRGEANRLLVGFYIDGQHMAVDVSRVQEIIQPQTMTPIPTAEEHFAGLINLRGQIVTAIDLRLLLGMEPAEDREACMNLVVNSEDGPVALLFDKVGDVRNVGQYMIEKPPTTMEPSLREYVEAVVKLKNDLLMLLNIDAVIGTQAANANA